MSVYSGPEIQTSSLVRCLDAGNTKSYSGSGNSWYNISGTSATYTLTGAVSYNSGGYMTLDGANTTYISNLTNPVNIANTNWTCIFWAYSTGTITYWPTVWRQGGGSSVIQIATCHSAGKVLGLYATSPNITIFGSASIPYNTWHQGAITYNTTSGNAQFYFNGVADGSVQSLGAGRWSSASTNEYLGYWGGGQNLSGGISLFQVYTSELTADQIKQNFNAFRGRFGL